MALIKFTRDNFETEALNSSVPVLVDFYAEWCGPCRMLGPIIDELAEEATDFKVGKVNIDEQPELATKYQVMSVPTLIVLKNGEVVNRVTGVTPKQKILDMLGEVYFHKIKVSAKLNWSTLFCIMQFCKMRIYLCFVIFYPYI